jgi:hypothetical protein
MKDKKVEVISRPDSVAVVLNLNGRIFQKGYYLKPTPQQKREGAIPPKQIYSDILNTIKEYGK